MREWIINVEEGALSEYKLKNKINTWKEVRKNQVLEELIYNNKNKNSMQDLQIYTKF